MAKQRRKPRGRASYTPAPTGRVQSSGVVQCRHGKAAVFRMFILKVDDQMESILD